MLGTKPAISRHELEVVRVLWALGEATPRQVFDAYPNHRNIDFATVQTYLRRLEAKGYVRARRQGKTKFLRPAVRPGNVVRQTVDDLLCRLFDGQAMPLMRHLINERGVTQSDIDQLRNLIDLWEGENRDSGK